MCRLANNSENSEQQRAARGVVGRGTMRAPWYRATLRAPSPRSARVWRCGDGQAQRREDMYLRAVRHDGQAPRVVEGYTVSHKTFRKLLISPGASVQNGYRTVDYALARSWVFINSTSFWPKNTPQRGKQRERGCSHLILAGGGCAAQRNCRRQGKCPTVN